MIIFKPCSSSTQVLECIYCPQPAELPCDISNPAFTGMAEIKGKEFDSPDARLFLAIIHRGRDGVMRLCPHCLGLEPGVISSVWINTGMGIPPGHTPVDNERIEWNHFLFFFIYLFLNLFIYLFLAVLGLCCRAWASHCSGFSCCGAQALGVQASVAVARGL